MMFARQLAFANSILVLDTSSIVKYIAYVTSINNLVTICERKSQITLQLQITLPSGNLQNVRPM